MLAIVVFHRFQNKAVVGFVFDTYVCMYLCLSAIITRLAEPIFRNVFVTFWISFHFITRLQKNKKFSIRYDFFVFKFVRDHLELATRHESFSVDIYW